MSKQVGVYLAVVPDTEVEIKNKNVRNIGNVLKVTECLPHPRSLVSSFERSLVPISDASPLFFSHLNHRQSGFHHIKANQPSKAQTDFYLLAVVLSIRNGQRSPNKEIGKMRH